MRIMLLFGGVSKLGVGAMLTLKTKVSRSCAASFVSASSCSTAPFISQEELVSPGWTRAAAEHDTTRHSTAQQNAAFFGACYRRCTRAGPCPPEQHQLKLHVRQCVQVCAATAWASMHTSQQELLAHDVHVRT
jgi:hypothetical protein